MSAESWMPEAADRMLCGIVDAGKPAMIHDAAAEATAASYMRLMDYNNA
jgi:hypothetical protein